MENIFGTKVQQIPQFGYFSEFVQVTVSEIYFITKYFILKFDCNDS